MEKKKKKGMGLKWILVIAVVVLSLFMALINFFTDLLWFKEIGYVDVFLKKLITVVQVGIPLFIVLFILSFIYLKMLKRGYYKKVESNDVVNEKRLTGITFGYSFLFSLLISFMVSTQLWFEILKYINSTGFGIADPLYNIDISFYVFKLAFVQELNQIVIGIVIAYVILTVLYYMTLMAMRKPQMFEEVPPAEDEAEAYARQGEQHYQQQQHGNAGGFGGGHFGGMGGMGGMGDIFGQLGKAFGFGGGGQSPFSQQARPKKKFDNDNFMNLIHIASKQLIVMGVVFFIMIGVNFFLKQYDLLYSHTGVLYGAGFTDINITLWMYRILIGLSLVAAIMFVIGIAGKKFKMILTVPVIMIVVGLIGSGTAYVVQNWVVSPDEINKESQYLERNIKYTRLAYGLDKVTTKTFNATSDLTFEDIQNNPETISNIRINDYLPVKSFYNQTQNLRQYYTFNDVDVDRYVINGDYTQTFLSAREIDETKISSAWLNQHLKYTHGYGLTLSRVDKITPSGQPDVLIDSIPPVSRVEEITIDRPEIYFGESTRNYILVGTNEEEFDYPEGDNNRYAKYEGEAGIKLNLLNRLMFAIREQSVKMLVSTNLDKDSKIIIYRNVIERVHKIMPQLAYEDDPYMVTVDGKLYWIVDAYTTSSYYPYSEPYDATRSRINYIRNSVKVVIDAYNGTVNFYLVDNKDPIANTYKEIYPTLFKDFEQMPESLQKHIRYPHTLFNIQANVYKRYHMSDVKVFYQGEDLWDISKEIYGTKEVDMVPNYYIFKLPGEEKAEFLSSIPFTPRDKKNMIALLIARNDGDHYSELVLYQLPKSRLIYGPMQIEAMIDQNTEISKEFSLWNSSGSTYSRGNMFVIPIEDSLLYVEPVYLEATNSSIPEVKRVIVAYGDTIAYKPTLGEALESLFGSVGQGSVPPSGTTTPADGSDTFTHGELITLAQEAFANAQEAQKNGDWASYGNYLKQLEEYLNLLAK